MVPPNFFSKILDDKPANGPISSSKFCLSSDGKICVDGVNILPQVRSNITLSSFSSVPHSSSTDCPAPPRILKSVSSNSAKGAFLSLSVSTPLDRIENPIGKLITRKFLSIFRFKTWWSTMWIGSNGSDLQMETQLILLQMPEINSYVLIIPLIEVRYDQCTIHIMCVICFDQVVLCVKGGSSKVKAKSFSSCAYLHVGENPYDLLRDAFAAIRVHLGSFRLLEEKTSP
ncbi:hypothetical protein Ancab_012979 [Ancistrocladus abbreviatus]